jgi:hypothetical protein
LKATLEVINRMQADGVIGRYAIGGAVGATFYLEPVATLDILILVSFQKVPTGGLISLSPIYDYLTARGYKAEGEYIITFMSEWMRRILESKRAMRRGLAALPFSEKVKLLEQLRDRSRAIASSPLKNRKGAVAQVKPG